MNYEKLKSKYERQYKGNLVIGIALIVIGLATIGVHLFSAIILCLMGISLWAMARKNKEKNFSELAQVKSPEDFNKSMGKSLLEMPEFSLYISDKYVVSELKSLKVYPLKEMKKFEVGIAGDKKKTLFLTDKSNVRWEIASTVKGDKRQEAFDKAYYKVKDIFDNKKYNRY